MPGWDRLMRLACLGAIRGYQRFVSPYKGFGCAYRLHTGRASCSVLGYRAVRRHGVLSGLALARRRMHLCGVVHRRQQGFPGPLHRASQRGLCDLGCDAPCDASCDLPSGGSGRCRGLDPSSCCDSGCCDVGSCDWPQRKRRDRWMRDQEKLVYIPPASGHRRPTQDGRRR